ncbi:PqiC family protein [Jannaschia aquimarina]|uniref:ABC-type transport auxiliary lipoprotein component domain-containing protein n=1 Tax=Jannaschia aquimarina TaxID=935700 RepID=A0A0D1EHU5_9RHOB|nr:PqiC family protein [Jannaschia aquimarina]KIT15400.1 hypothetical protein jaqu_28340 [Jannaschia aquimarina]SNT22847.1 hypothetical protein SAMN05421775_10880 [Jannaschia aquimarina]
MRLICLTAFLLAGCGQTLYYTPPPANSDLRVNARARTVMINEVSMPEYAINQEIPIQTPDGGLQADTDQLWADLPDRALQVALTRHLNQITDAQVAAEPWPLSGFPEIEVSVTVETMIVQADGRLRFTGLYALRNDATRGGRIETFELFAPVPGEGYPAIIAAHEAAWLQLAETIARQI